MKTAHMIILDPNGNYVNNVVVQVDDNGNPVDWRPPDGHTLELTTEAALVAKQPKRPPVSDETLRVAAIAAARKAENERLLQAALNDPNAPNEVKAYKARLDAKTR